MRATLPSNCQPSSERPNNNQKKPANLTNREVINKKLHHRATRRDISSFKPDNSSVSQMDVFEAIRSRRSTRSYQTKPVEEEKLANILEAAKLAPSAANRQPSASLSSKAQKPKNAYRKPTVDHGSGKHP